MKISEIDKEKKRYEKSINDYNNIVQKLSERLVLKSTKLEEIQNKQKEYYRVTKEMKILLKNIWEEVAYYNQIFVEHNSR
jgi:predicted  nucleic acid-binding Zn-ribbon protein